MSSRPAPIDECAGIGLQISATFFFAIMSTMVRVVADQVLSGEIVFARSFSRSFFGGVPLVVWLLWSGRMTSDFRTRQPAGHVIRGLVGVNAMWLTFGALAFIPLDEAVALSYATPLVAVILAGFVLDARESRAAWARSA
ncbi:EamA family transporter [Xanthobacter sp. KR7-65]|uniref:EamA family transporter n=1 Tax=Xanthobacter sp. KR7-65 TaxID=3156612 RepID=UPI0032B4AB2C